MKENSLPYDHKSIALGSLSLHRTAGNDTLSAYSAFHADINQFDDPETALKGAQAAEMLDEQGGDMLVADITSGLTFFDPIGISQLSDPGMVKDLADRFNDQANFDVRVCGITGATLPYLRRLKAPMSDTKISGLAIIESIATVPGFDPMDVLHASLKQLSVMTANSNEAIFWMLTVRDLAQSRFEMNTALAAQFAFMKKYPCWSAMTFPDIGPLSGTLAGIIPGRARWAAQDDYCVVGTDHAVKLQDTEDFA